MILGIPNIGIFVNIDIQFYEKYDNNNYLIASRWSGPDFKILV